MPKPGFSEELFLTNATGKHLYMKYAAGIPIIDFHCHLSPEEIYEDKQFSDIGEMWLKYDHYKWRAMRCFGIDERLITGDASFREKFMALAGIMPELAGNPIYIWCALELKRFFDIDTPLSADTAEEIFARAAAITAERRLSPRRCIALSNVRALCTTDDPVDDLKYHAMLRADADFDVRVLPTFRPDKAMNCSQPSFAAYLPQLEEAAGMRITSFRSLIAALIERLAFFREAGCLASDTGFDNFMWHEATDEELDGILARARRGEPVSKAEADAFLCAFLLAMGEEYHRADIIMQLHIGVFRNCNSAMFARIGADSGHDCTNSPSDIRSMSKLFDALDRRGCLPKTVIYPLNPVDVEPYAILAAAFCHEPNRAHVQLGAPWWFNDQAYGINRQFAAVANLYPLSLSAGMLTDSRSFLSYPRHELYRRVLCNYLGELIERGEYFHDEAYVKKIIENICYHNAAEYLGL